MGKEGSEKEMGKEKRDERGKEDWEKDRKRRMEMEKKDWERGLGKAKHSQPWIRVPALSCLSFPRNDPLERIPRG